MAEAENRAAEAERRAAEAQGKAEFEAQEAARVRVEAERKVEKADQDLAVCKVGRQGWGVRYSDIIFSFSSPSGSIRDTRE